jgi:hypothetical protein
MVLFWSTCEFSQQQPIITSIENDLTPLNRLIGLVADGLWHSVVQSQSSQPSFNASPRITIWDVSWLAECSLVLVKLLQSVSDSCNGNIDVILYLTLLI